MVKMKVKERVRKGRDENNVHKRREAKMSSIRERSKTRIQVLLVLSTFWIFICWMTRSIDMAQCPQRCTWQAEHLSVARLSLRKQKH